jgi:hypothetical protein
MLHVSFLISYSINKFFSLTFQSYLIYDHDINIPRNNSDLTPVYLERPNGQLDPVTGDNYYFIEYSDFYANPTNYSVRYVDKGIADGILNTADGDYQGYRVVKSGPALQFLEYWMVGLSFSF